jgi:PAS domain-containing protein
MLNDDRNHSDLIKGISSQYQEILDASQQSIYIYMDDNHKVCNAKFATLLGYRSPEEWAQVKGSFLQQWVEPDSQNALAEAYNNAMEKRVGSSFKVTWKTKSGGSVNSFVILVPIAFDGHLFALHYIS